MKKLLAVIMGAMILFCLAGCGEVDKETQAFANKYNKQRIETAIARIDLKAATDKMNLANGYALIPAVENHKATASDFVHKANKLAELKKNPLYEKASKANLIKEYKNMTRDELAKAYSEIK